MCARMRAYVCRLIQSSSPARSAHWGPRLSLSSPEAGTASAVLNGQGRERCSVTQATTRAEARLPGHPGRPVLPASLRQLRHCDSCTGTETARPALENICWPGPRHWGALETLRPSRPPAAAARGPAPPRTCGRHCRRPGRHRGRGQCVPFVFHSSHKCQVCESQQMCEHKVAWGWGRVG